MDKLSISDVSKFLTEDVIQQALKVKIGYEEDIKDIKVERAAPIGSGLLGAVYRIKVYSNIHTTSFIAKGMVQDPLLRKSLQTEKFFKREIVFFTEILPILNKFQKSSGAVEKIQNYIPICYAHHCDGINDFILMEDLIERNCYQIPQDPSEIERDAMLNTLAHLHAVSMGIRKKQPDVFEKISQKVPETYFIEDLRNWYADYYKSAVDITLKTLAEFEDPKTSVYYKKYFDLLNNDPYGQLISLTAAKSVHNVLNHGDPWTLNYFTSETRAVMVDFQLARCVSPAIDLSFMLLLICRQNPKTEYALDAIKIYHDALSHYLKDMDLEPNQIFSLQDLLEELKKYGRFGLLASTTTIPQLCAKRCDVLDDFESKYGGVEAVPLAELWRLSPFEREEDKKTLVNAVRIAVDLEFL